MVRRLLVPLDGSKQVEQALPVAMYLAQPPRVLCRLTRSCNWSFPLRIPAQNGGILSTWSSSRCSKRCRS